MSKKYTVRVFRHGVNKPATAQRYYDTWAQARRYQDAQVKKGIVAVAERTNAAPVRTNQHGSW